MKIKSKEEVILAYSRRYPALDSYFIKSLEEEYDRYFSHLKTLTSKESVNLFFESEIAKNENIFKDNALLDGLEATLHDQYMSVLANYGLIVFFRDTMIDWDE